MKTHTQSLLRLATVAAALLLGATHQLAAQDHFKDCADLSGNPAIEACTRGINSGSYQGERLALLYYNRAFELDNEGDIKNAHEDLTQAIKINPKYANAFHNRALLREKLNDRSGAISDYSQSISIQKSAKSYANRGVLLARNKDYGKAIADYNEAIKLSPQYALAFYNRAIAYEAEKKIDLAIADYNDAIRFNPKYVQALNNRGRIYKARGDKERAIADFRRALDIDPGFTLARNNLEEMGVKP